MRRAAFQNRLVNLYSQGNTVISVRMQRSEQCTSASEIAVGLRDKCLEREGLDVIWRNIQNLIKLSQRFGETSKQVIVYRVPAEQVTIARVELLGVVKV